MVGKAIGGRLVELGHEVRMGSRTAGNEAAVEWAGAAGEGASEGTFADAAGFGEVIFNCTAGAHSLEALAMAGAENLDGKVLIDVSNGLDSADGAPGIKPIGDDSIGERIQREFPGARVVKSLNTVNANVMVRPDLIPGDHVIFVAGDDDAAKATTVALLGEFGWPPDRILDLGDIRQARATEAYLLLWIALWGTLDTAQFNITIAR